MNTQTSLKSSVVSVAAVAALTGLLSSCGGGGLTVQGIDLGRVVNVAKTASNLGEKTEADEIEIGRDTAMVLLETTPLANDDQLQGYVNKVGYWLAKHSSRPQLQWHFVVLNNSSVNAFAAPGGYVFITTGMLANLYNEAELAGVLAHEMAHVEERHHLKALEAKSHSRLTSDLLVLASQASDRDDDGGGGGASFDSRGVFHNAVTDVYERGLDRQDEHRADLLGLQLAAKAGYDPYAFVSVLQNLQSRESEEESLLEQFMATHPRAGERLSYLEPQLMRLDGLYLNSRVLAQRFTLNTRY